MNEIGGHNMEINKDEPLIDATIEITRECPLDCLICSSNGGVKYPQEVSFDNWKKIIDELSILGTKSIQISGGEPFSCSYLIELCQYITREKIPLSIYTSGNIKIKNKLTSLKKSCLKQLSQLNNIKMIFSLEGASNQIHDEMTCQEGSFNNTLISIKRAKSVGLSTEIHFVPTKLNYMELSDIIKISQNLGVEKVSVLRFVPQGRGMINQTKLLLDLDNDLKFKNILINLFKTYSEYIRLGSPLSIYGLNSNNCNCGENRLTIRYDGKVFPCEALKFLGNNYEDNDVIIYPIRYILDKSKIFNEIKQFKNNFIELGYLNSNNIVKNRGGCLAQKILKNENKKVAYKEILVNAT